MRAVSVPGVMGSHSAADSGGMSERRGLTLMKRQPRAAAACMRPRSMCWATPPAATAVFLMAMPPKASTVSVWATIWSQVTTARVTAAKGPRMCGNRNVDAPAL